MQPNELRDIIDFVQRLQSETDAIEVKSAHRDCPKRLYDTLSSFSNRDEVRSVERATKTDWDSILLERFMLRLKENKPNLSQLPDERIHELMSLTRSGKTTLCSLFLLCSYPQTFFPQLGIIATVVPGLMPGEESPDGIRFIDNKRIEGTLPQMLEDSLAFVMKNMRHATRIDAKTGLRNDKTEYPIKAVRECVLNALVHRDYSIHTEGMPIQLIMYQDRIEIINPGGLYGRIGVDQLGRVQADTRNPVLANAMEILGLVENRYSGIPTIQREMRMNHLPDPQFSENRGSFCVKLYNDVVVSAQSEHNRDSLLDFCKTPRTRNEIARFLNLKSVTYAMKKHVLPLVETGEILLSIPEKPGSIHQRYVSAHP